MSKCLKIISVMSLALLVCTMVFLGTSEAKSLKVAMLIPGHIDDGGFIASGL